METKSIDGRELDLNFISELLDFAVALFLSVCMYRADVAARHYRHYGK